MTPPATERKRPGPRPRLSQDEILDVALRVLTLDGPEGLSLRRLGQELGVTARTLYGYFASKDELETALVARLVPAPPSSVAPDRSTGSQLETFLMEVHDALALHPGVARLFVARSVRNPAADRIREHILELLLAGGLGIADAVVAVGALSRYLLGSLAIADELGRRGADGEDPHPPDDAYPALQRAADIYARRNSTESTRAGMRLLIGALDLEERASSASDLRPSGDRA